MPQLWQPRIKPARYMPQPWQPHIKPAGYMPRSQAQDALTLSGIARASQIPRCKCGVFIFTFLFLPIVSAHCLSFVSMYTAIISSRSSSRSTFMIRLLAFLWLVI